MNNNQLSGRLPDGVAEGLVVLTLHRNSFSGPLPSYLQDLRHLSVLTLHENLLDGTINPLALTAPCLDNPRFKLRGTSCDIFRMELQGKDCGSLMWTLRLEPDEWELILENCPDLCGTCSKEGSANVTFHHNRFSCHVPDTISENPESPIHATAVMGNMLGEGLKLNASWISTQEQQAFLYYSPKVWEENCFVMVSMLLLLLAACLFWRRLQTQLAKALRSLSAGAASRVAASNLALLKAAGLSTLMSSPLLLIFWAGRGYHSCSPPLSNLTVANLRENGWAELGIVIAWCGAMLHFKSILASMPNFNDESLPRFGASAGNFRDFTSSPDHLSLQGMTRGQSCKEKFVKALAWMLCLGSQTRQELL